MDISHCPSLSSVSLGLTSMRSNVVRELRTLLALKLLCSDKGP